MATEIKRRTARIQEIVDWLRQQKDTWWAIDGDWQLQSHVEMPASNDVLADALEQYSSVDKELQVLTDDCSGTGIEGLFKGANGNRRLTAEGGVDDDGWILVEQTDWVNEVNTEITSPSTTSE